MWKLDMKNIMLSCLLILLTFNFYPATAQEDGANLTNYLGHYNYKYVKYDAGYDNSQKYTIQEESVIKVKLESISNYLLSYESVKNLKGVEIIANSLISEKPTFIEPLNSVKSELRFLVYPWFLSNGKPEYKCIECNVDFTISINRLDLILSGYTIGDVFDKDGIPINLEPVEIGKQDGCTIYENGTVVVSNGNPLWVPITVSEYDEALINKCKKLAEEKPEEAEFNRLAINMLNSEIASFSSEELDSPAYQGDKMGGCPYKLEGARAIVKLNKDYFDNKKPRTAPQLIIIESGCIQLREDNDYYFKDENSTIQHLKLVEILRNLKYSEFKRFLE